MSKAAKNARRATGCLPAPGLIREYASLGRNLLVTVGADRREQEPGHRILSRRGRRGGTDRLSSRDLRHPGPSGCQCAGGQAALRPGPARLPDMLSERANPAAGCTLGRVRFRRPLRPGLTESEPLVVTGTHRASGAASPAAAAGAIPRKPGKLPPARPLATRWTRGRARVVWRNHAASFRLVGSPRCGSCVTSLPRQARLGARGALHGGAGLGRVHDGRGGRVGGRLWGLAHRHPGPVTALTVTTGTVTEVVTGGSGDYRRRLTCQ